MKITPKPQEEEWLELFLSHCHRRNYPTKSSVIMTGDEADVLYYIVSGSVKVLIEEDEMELSGDHELVLTYLNKGDFFGELGLFGDEQTRSARVVTRTECELAEISYSRFRQLAIEEPEILFNLATQIANRLRNTSQKAGNLAFLDVTGRIAATLLDLAQQPDAMTHPDGMQIKISRQEIGKIVGCSREMAGRVLKILEEQNLITAHGMTIVVLGTR